MNAKILKDYADWIAQVGNISNLCSKLVEPMARGGSNPKDIYLKVAFIAKEVLPQVNSAIRGIREGMKKPFCVTVMPFGLHSEASRFFKFLFICIEQLIKVTRGIEAIEPKEVEGELYRKLKLISLDMLSLRSGLHKFHIVLRNHALTLTTQKVSSVVAIDIVSSKPGKPITLTGSWEDQVSKLQEIIVAQQKTPKLKEEKENISDKDIESLTQLMEESRPRFLTTDEVAGVVKAPVALVSCSISRVVWEALKEQHEVEMEWVGSYPIIKNCFCLGLFKDWVSNKYGEPLNAHKILMAANQIVNKYKRNFGVIGTVRTLGKHYYFLLMPKAVLDNVQVYQWDFALNREALKQAMKGAYSDG